MTIIASILVLGILIFVHELGHFLLAKLNGIGVYEFSIGFGKKLWRGRIGDTYYAVGAIPLGGYVSMAGDDPALVMGRSTSKNQDSEEYSKEESEEEAAERRRLESDPLAKKLLEDESSWFLKKSYPAKLSVVLAGPFFNFLLAIVLSIFSYAVFGALVPVDDPVIGEVVPGLSAEKSGLKPGDRILSINGGPMRDWYQVAEYVGSSGGRELNMRIERPAENSPGQSGFMDIKVAASLDYEEYAVVKGEKNDKYRIGIAQSTKKKDVTLSEAALDGTLHVWNLSVMTLRGIGGIIQGAISPKHIAGPIFIFQTAARTARKGLEPLINFVVFLSVSLAILNLLPIPVLDGGHVLFFTIEAIIRRPVSLKVQQTATQVGLAFLLLLTLFAVGNDIARFF